MSVDAAAEMLGVEDRVDAPGLLLNPLDLGQFLERDHARLVDHVVLAVPHRGKADPRPILRYRGADDDGDAVVLEDLAGIVNAPRLRVAFREGSGEIVLFGEEGDELGPGAEKGIDLTEDMVVVDADDGEANSGC